MAKDHGPTIKKEELRTKGMSKGRAAAIANTPGASKKGGETLIGAQAVHLQTGDSPRA